MRTGEPVDRVTGPRARGLVVFTVASNSPEQESKYSVPEEAREWWVPMVKPK